MGLFLASILIYKIESCLGYFASEKVLKLGNVNSSHLFIFDKIVLVILGLLCFSMNFRISLSISPHQTCWHFDWDYAEFINQFGEKWSLINTESSNLWTCIYLHLLSFLCVFLVLPVYCYQPVTLHPHAHMLSHVTPCTTACQAPLSMGFSRQEYWSGLPFPFPPFFFSLEKKPICPELNCF